MKLQTSLFPGKCIICNRKITTIFTVCSLKCQKILNEREQKLTMKIEESCPGDYFTPPYEGGVIGYHRVLICLTPSHPLTDVTEVFESLTDNDEVLDQLNERVKDMHENS